MRFTLKTKEKNILDFFSFRLKKSMDKVQHITKISSRLGYIQEFCEFVDTIHTVAIKTSSQCPVEIFNVNLKKTV